MCLVIIFSLKTVLKAGAGRLWEMESGQSEIVDQAIDEDSSLIWSTTGNFAYKRVNE